MSSSSSSAATGSKKRVGSHTIFAVIVLIGLITGAVLYPLGNTELAHAAWAAANGLVLLPLTWAVLKALRAGRIGVDIIALLAMVGALLTGEYLAGAVIALMLSGGNALEEYAQGRAGRELSLLVGRAPKEAHVHRDNAIVEVAAAEVVVGDVVVVRAGEIVPVDGTIVGGVAVVDQAALTGEPIPVSLAAGSMVMSGSANAGNSFELKATSTADASMYASIVRLVEQAIERRSPMVRMADRYSLLFLIVALSLSAIAWIVSGDPVRALAVLVIATPCPLILAPPVALVAGTSRAARRGIIVKGSAAIEMLGQAHTVLIDKTGTVTLGTPQLHRVVPHGAWTSDELLRAAGSIEQMSVHSLAEAITHAASELGSLAIPTEVEEEPGHGISGNLAGQVVMVGSRSYLKARSVDVPLAEDSIDGIAAAYIAIDGAYAGLIELADLIREDAYELPGRLKELGIQRLVMVTGDHAVAAQKVADQIGITELHADCTADEKLTILHQLKEEAGSQTVIMVGDGVNDAPALAAADVGIAMGSAGATAASESAEAVIIAPRISLVADAIALGRRSRSIALQSVIVGIGLSITGMFVAAAGYLPPTYGALAQEVIDLAVILNALRALGGGDLPDE